MFEGLDRAILAGGMAGIGVGIIMLVGIRMVIEYLIWKRNNRGL